MFLKSQVNRITRKKLDPTYRTLPIQITVAFPATGQMVTRTQDHIGDIIPANDAGIGTWDVRLSVWVGSYRFFEIRLATVLTPLFEQNLTAN